jgi:hypothetical protein
MTPLSRGGRDHDAAASHEFERKALSQQDAVPVNCIAWESETVSDHKEKEGELIRLSKPNDPTVGDDRWPRFKSGKKDEYTGILNIPSSRMPPDRVDEGNTHLLDDTLDDEPYKVVDRPRGVVEGRAGGNNPHTESGQSKHVFEMQRTQGRFARGEH